MADVMEQSGEQQKKVKKVKKVVVKKSTTTHTDADGTVRTSTTVEEQELAGSAPDNKENDVPAPQEPQGYILNRWHPR